ncbi:hypothetical protein D6783_04795 [Candidatus Woesearchaeota archaeon]|nr:MAG: hypothetical protein D6783_04795 [Candidatus Woesearchaeota archaeon]
MGTLDGKKEDLKALWLVPCTMLVVICPRCGKSQRCQPRKGDITKKRKRCVYCGRTFNIRPSPDASRIRAVK